MPKPSNRSATHPVTSASSIWAQMIWYPDKQGFDFNIGGCDFGQPPSYFDPYSRKGQGQIPTLKPRREGEYLTDREADEAVKFIRRQKDKPFFL